MIPWTGAHQTPLSVGFFRKEYRNGLPFPTLGNLPNPGIKPTSPALTGIFFTTVPSGKPMEWIAKYIPNLHPLLDLFPRSWRSRTYKDSPQPMNLNYSGWLQVSLLLSSSYPMFFPSVLSPSRPSHASLWLLKQCSVLLLGFCLWPTHTWAASYSLLCTLKTCSKY